MLSTVPTNCLQKILLSQGSHRDNLQDDGCVAPPLERDGLEVVTWLHVN